MDDWVRKELDDRITKLERESVWLRKGVVTAIDPLSVALGGADPADAIVGLSAIDGLALAVDDVVSVLARGNDMLIAGRVGGPKITTGTVSMNFGATVGARVTGIAHGLGTTPVAVFTNLVVSDGGTGAARFTSNASDLGATTFAINGRRIDGSTGGVLDCVWLAVG